MKDIRYMAAAAASIFIFSASASSLSVADYCSPDASRPKGVKEMTPMPDGISYAAISDDGRSIETFSYKTGKKTGTLFSVDNIKGDVKISEFDGYTLSDNGKKILLWNDSKQIYRRSFTAEFFVYDIMRGTMARVSEKGRQRGAVISHDGRMVAYTRDNNIFISNLDYKTDNQVTKDGEMNNLIYGVPDWAYEEEFGIDNTIRWSADDCTLAFMSFDERLVPTYHFDNYTSYCDNDKPDFYPEVYSYKYPLAGYPNSQVAVYAYNVDNRVIKKMDLPIGENDYVPSLEFDGNGDQLMVMVLNRDQNNLQLYKVNPGSTVARSILTETSDAWLNPSAYQMVDYGKKTFVIGSERNGWRHLYEYDYNGKNIRQVTSGDFNVTAYYGRNAAGTHFMQTTLGGAINRTIVSVDAMGKKGVVLSPEEGTSSASFSSGREYFLLTYSSASVPTQYTIHDARGKKLVDVELNKEYAAKYSGAPKMEFMKVPNAEGKEMNAYVIKPLNFDSSRKYPLVMYQYNGPDSQEVLNKWRMEGIFYLASQGYVVAAVDGRGTGNRERSWATAVYKRLGQLETADQIAGARHFMSLPYVDSDKVACFGWSYGGYMTLMELTASDSPFKAGVAMAPVTDWRFYDSVYTERYMLTPQQNEEGYRLGSALGRTGSLKGKLLIASGSNDDNVHFVNTLQFTSKLTSEGKLCDMMVFSGWEHSLRMCNAREMLFRKINDFLNINLIGD